MENSSNKISKVIKISVLSLFYGIIALLLLFSIATLSVKRADDIPNLFGKGFLAVDARADSMDGNKKDSFKPGDLVFVKVLSDKQRNVLDLQKLFDDKVVISFYDHNIKSINTHRIVEYDASTGYIRTQGDKEGLDLDNFYLSKVDIVGIYTGKARGMGKPIAFMQTPLGFGLIVVLPTLALLIYQGVALMRNLYVVKENKLRESISDNNDLERERIRAELLEEMRKENEAAKKRESED